jgi:YfiH family protein
MGLYFFHLNFSLEAPFHARFPFIFEDHPVPGMGCLISSRAAGDMVYSAGDRNPRREAFFRSLGAEPAAVYACTQRHSRDVLAVDRNSPNSGPPGDGLVSRDFRVALSVTVADCLPVFLYDTRGGGDAPGGGFALVHSGWRGTGIVLEALRLMAGHTRPGDIAAVLGPCIRGCWYRVDEGRAREFEAEFGGPGGAYPLGPVIRPVHRDSREPGFYLNLQAANVRLLTNAGVRNIAVCEDCTFTDERLGSFRREGKGYTRMAAVLGQCAAPESPGSHTPLPPGGAKEG